MMENVISLAQAIAACVALLSVIWILLSNSVKVPKGAPPGSFGWPLIGETVEFIRLRHKSSAFAFFNEKRKRYADVFRTHLFFSPTVVIAGVDAHKLLQSDGYRMLTFGHFSTMKELFGKTSLILTEGDQHKRMRKAIMGSMNWRILQCQIPRLQELSIQTLKSWTGTEISASEELAKFTFYSITGWLLSLKPSPYSEYLRQNFRTLAKNAASLPFKFPGTSYSKALKARKVLIGEIKKILEDRRKNESNNGEEDFLDYVLHPNSESESQLTEEEIIDNIIFFTFAGYETTTTALSKIIQLLAEYPHELEIVKAEQKKIEQEIGDEGALTWEKVKSMHYTTMVINEVLRLSNLGSEVLLRTAKQDISFREYTIPKGWNVMIDKVTTDKNPNIYADPTKFKPARFREPLPPYAFTPFGGGTRLCAGMEFANLEMLVFIHHLVNNYKWRLTRDDNNELEFTETVQKPKNGLPIVLESLWE